jgi:hypothetical protein
MSRNDEREWSAAQSGKLHEARAKQRSDEGSKNDWNVRYGHPDKVEPNPQLTALVTINEAKFARFARDAARIVEGDKVEKLVVGVRPVLRGFRYGGNIRLPSTPRLFNCDALEVYVDGQRFTLHPGSDMEVGAATTARMEVEPTGRSTASIESVLCTFYGKP